MERYIRDRQLGIRPRNRPGNPQPVSPSVIDMSDYARYCKLMNEETNPGMRNLWGGMMALERLKMLAKLSGQPEPTQNMISWEGDPINYSEPAPEPEPEPEPQN